MGIPDGETNFDLWIYGSGFDKGEFRVSYFYYDENQKKEIEKILGILDLKKGNKKDKAFTFNRLSFEKHILKKKGIFKIRFTNLQIANKKAQVKGVAIMPPSETTQFQATTYYQEDISYIRNASYGFIEGMAVQTESVPLDIEIEVYKH